MIEIRKETNMYWDDNKPDYLDPTMAVLDDNEFEKWCMQREWQRRVFGWKPDKVTPEKKAILAARALAICAKKENTRDG